MDEFEITDAMTKHGGGFVKALANCYRHADKQNKEKLKFTFFNYFMQYEEVAKKNKEENKGGIVLE